jgi:hypothetical protein
MFKMLSTLTLLGLATFSGAYAQSGQPVQAKVPFAFMVQHTTLASGNYRLTYNNTAHVLTIRGLDQNSDSILALATPTIFESASAAPRLVFNCHGKACYLAQVWSGEADGNCGLILRPTEPDRKLALSTRAVSITISAK